ncbi:MAG TPA: AbrB/MazE/SpoVT family DNA-binding domain-containing protein [bacterium]|nr:AbrB/MazE/SpoVT family DNA-binding domain-containing protein [bacterium]
MIKKLTKHGNSYALIIERPIMDLLHISEKSELYVTTDGRNLVISPADDKKKKTAFDSALGEANRKYGQALKRLS